MNKSTRVVTILDRSRSTMPIQAATANGFNSFVKILRGQSGPCNLKLVQFDTDYMVKYDNAVKTFPELQSATSLQEGKTRLYDAIGRTIEETNTEIANLPENERPGAVVMLIMTDNYDTASKRTQESARELISRQQKDENWQFVFLGANQDAITQANALGIDRHSALTYETQNPESVNNCIESALTAAANYINSVRVSVQDGKQIDALFSDDDRHRATGWVGPVDQSTEERAERTSQPA